MTKSTIAVCIASYLRPLYLDNLLHTIGETLVPAGSRVVVVVCDNDPAESARTVVEKSAINFPFELVYTTELVRGIASARNQLVAEATRIGAEYIAFVDDDQAVDPQWLHELLQLAESSSAQAVWGNALPKYEPGVPDWVINSGYFARSTRPAAGTRAETFGTGNILFRADALAQIPGPFDTSLNLTGGSDAALAREFNKRGFISVSCPESIAYERIPASRATARWIIGRRFRVGYVSGLNTRRSNGSWRQLTRFVAESLAVLGKYLLLLFPWSIRKKRAGLVLALAGVGNALGRFAGLAGLNFQEYRQTHGN